MKKYNFIISVISIILVTVVLTNIFSCSDNSKKTNFTTTELNEQLVMATLWMQTSAEYRALCYQTFNLAKLNLDKTLSSPKVGKPLAIIVDADETIIDNSDYEAFLIGKNFGYSSDTWNKWMDAAEAKAIPGAVEFLNYASKKGVEIFYITNRRVIGYEGTEKNLKQLKFPNVNKKHLLLRTDTRNKQPRRDIVEKDYTVVLLLGDNLNDFQNIFAEKSMEERFAETDKLKELWGKKFIVLPNPLYGEWEGAIYNYDYGASVADKNIMRKKSLNRWDFTGSD